MYVTKDPKKFRSSSFSFSCLINYSSFCSLNLPFLPDNLKLISLSFSLEPSNAQSEQNPVFQTWLPLYINLCINQIQMLCNSTYC